MQVVPARAGLVNDPNLPIQAFQIRKQTPVTLVIRNQLKLSAWTLFITSVLSNRPLVCVIVDPNPVDNLHDPFLLVCGSVPLNGSTHEKVHRATGSLHLLYRTCRHPATLPRYVNLGASRVSCGERETRSAGEGRWSSSTPLNRFPTVTDVQGPMSS